MMIAETILTKTKTTVPPTLANHPSSDVPMADVFSALGNATTKMTAEMALMNKNVITKIVDLENSLAKTIGASLIAKCATESMIAKITPLPMSLKKLAKIVTSHVLMAI